MLVIIRKFPGGTILALLFVAAFPFSAFTQFSEAWQVTHNETNGPVERLINMDLDADGNLYATGYSSIGQGPLSDTVTVKVNREGQKLWSRRFSVGKSDQVSQVKADPFGNVWVLGTRYESNSPSIFLLKYDGNGTSLWEASPYEGMASTASQLVCDATGNAYVSSSSRFEEIGHTLTLKFAPSGNVLWAARYTNETPNVFGSRIGLDRSNQVCVSFATAQREGLRVLRYSTEGELASTIPYSSIPSMTPKDWVFDRDENLIWCAKYNGFTTVKFNAQGEQLWLAYQPSAYFTFHYPNSIAVDSQGNPHVTGVMFSRGCMLHCYGVEAFTIKYDSEGRRVWMSQFNPALGDSTQVQGFQVRIRQDGRALVLAGIFSDPYNFRLGLLDFDLEGNLTLTETVMNNSGGSVMMLGPDDDVYLTTTVGGDFLMAKYVSTNTINRPRILLEPNPLILPPGTSTGLVSAVVQSQGPYSLGWIRDGAAYFGSTNARVRVDRDYSVLVNYSNIVFWSPYLRVTQAPVLQRVGGDSNGTITFRMTNSFNYYSLQKSTNLLDWLVVSNFFGDSLTFTIPPSNQSEFFRISRER